MDLNHAAERVEDILGLQSPAIALAFVDRPPDAVDEFDGAAPSACGFWRLAETATFYAPAQSHGNCAVGAMVMGFDSIELGEALSESVEKMIGSSYLSPEEPANIPSIARDSAGIVYGPLPEFPLEPDVVLMWLSPAQAMLFGEAGGNVAWSDSSTGVVGRPACAALPLAMESARSQLSLGCIGMRTFTEVSDDRLLGVLPGAAVGSFAESLLETKNANARMAVYYQERKRADLAARDSVSEGALEAG
ncbi:MAG: DUF169 domain-containing protein [Actinomycetota bacterium]|nr:DUF169 domain-containing protein [Actinomycetota bacterium]